MLSFSFVGIFFIIRLLISLQLKPMRHVLNSAFLHFAGGTSGSSSMSNSSIIVGLLFSMFIVKNSMRPIATGGLKIWLKKCCHRYRSRTSFLLLVAKLSGQICFYECVKIDPFSFFCCAFFDFWLRLPEINILHVSFYVVHIVFAKCVVKALA